MKKILILLSIGISFTLISCSSENTEGTQSSTESVQSAPAGRQENVNDDESQKDVVKVAGSSKDHTTLVAALKQTDLVTALSNAGPFTVFAPTNDAFNKVDKATLESLMKDENKEALQNILQYHVTVSAIKAENLHDGQTLGMVNGDNIKVTVKDGKIMLNNSATIIASIPASNGMIHVIDGVLLPPTK